MKPKRVPAPPCERCGCTERYTNRDCPQCMLAKKRAETPEKRRERYEQTNVDFSEGLPPRCICGGDMVQEKNSRGNGNAWRFCSGACREVAREQAWRNLVAVLPQRSGRPRFHRAGFGQVVR